MSQEADYQYPHEIEKRRKRQAIAQAISEGRTYREIEQLFKTSSATISAVKKMMGGRM